MVKIKEYVDDIKLAQVLSYLYHNFIIQNKL